MIFSSITFLYFFLPLVILSYYITPKKYRNTTLLIYSLIFYFYGEQSPVLIIACILNYVFGLCINSSKENKKTYLILGITINLLLIAYYKYSNFFIENVNSLFDINIAYLSVILPLGISFFTFQNISYLIDVYRGEVTAQKNILKYSTYITFFPQLIAGPIVRYKDVNEQLESRNETFENFGKGVVRFVIGLSKKVLLANMLGEMSATLGDVADKSVMLYILQAIGWTMQIYFDFSGYSDMAIGLGLFFGFNLKENFNYPLMASSITDFWRRWHISLSSFFKDYVYIPLGGNRKGVLKQVFNILIVWALTGFWHGANWNFILWGIYFFVFLTIEKFILKKYIKEGIIAHIYTLVILLVSFVIFNIESADEIIVFLKSMFGFNNLPFANFETLYHFKNYAVILAVGVICSTSFVKYLFNKIEETNKLQWIVSILEIGFVVLAIIACTASLVSNSYNPFIYFRF